MKRIIFSLAFLAWGCTSESGDAQTETANSAGTAAMGTTGGMSVAGMPSVNNEGRDCRNAGLECGTGFQCRLNDDDGYECLPLAPQAGEPMQPTAGVVMTAGQSSGTAGMAGGMSSVAGEAMEGGQPMAGAPNAGQPASAGMPSQAGVPVSGEMMVMMAGVAASGGEIAVGGQHGAAGQSAMAGMPAGGQPLAGAPAPVAGAPAPVACYGVRPIEVRTGNPMPGAIAAVFEVSTCLNQPAPNLVEADFALFENGEPIDAVQASRTILDRKAAAFVTIVLDNSPSVAAANAVGAVADAALAYVTTALTDTEQVYVSVASFSRRFTVLAL